MPSCGPSGADGLGDAWPAPHRDIPWVHSVLLAVLLCPLHLQTPRPGIPPLQVMRCTGGAGVQPCVCVCVCAHVCARVYPRGSRRYVCTCVRAAPGAPRGPTALPSLRRGCTGTGDPAGGGGSMASPRAAELRSPGEAAAADGGGPGGLGPAPGPGLALALGCALSGAALVVLAGAVPRAARPDPTVPARQMERLEERAARLRARLDRCTVAGLALLALGGLLLAALLLAAAAARRRARAARRAGSTYGSVRLRLRRVSAEGAQALLESQLSPPPQQHPEGSGS
ncbi:transmembrane protein 74B [Gallus gallus]|uniref:transmembrane protein 74B n=1 Tax=Gallus gallus TaxID=9031 RepID=UPI001AE7A059|nr:transmembrane protein 74B [Gallus gallus]XP_040544126.1 transmembrane protein 74B [Gallus gallus]